MPSACVLSCRLTGRTWGPPSLSKSTTWAGYGAAHWQRPFLTCPPWGVQRRLNMPRECPPLRPPGASAATKVDPRLCTRFQGLRFLPPHQAVLRTPGCPAGQLSSDTVHPPRDGLALGVFTWTLLNILDVKTASLACPSGFWKSLLVSWINDDPNTFCSVQFNSTEIEGAAMLSFKHDKY